MHQCQRTIPVETSFARRSLYFECHNSLHMRSLAWLVLALAPLSLSPFALFAQKKPFDPAALLKIQRVGDPQLSPDGKTVAFSVALPDVAENKAVRSVWSVALEG